MHKGAPETTIACINDGHATAQAREQLARQLLAIRNELETARQIQASSDVPALKPYWGKPTVRDFRGGDGNTGIIRSPISAIALLDHLSSAV